MAKSWKIACGGVLAGAALYGAWERTQWCTSQFWGSTRAHGPVAGEMALTFDDGPNDRYTQQVLERLSQAGARATFFFIGEHARRLPWLVRRVAEAGHVVGNHTLSHRNLVWLRSREIRREVEECSKVLEDAMGAPVRYFRPPYGKRRPVVMQVARELGLETVLWNSMGFDWRRGRSPERIVRAVERGIRGNREAGRGSTILLHDGAPEGAAADRERTVTALGLLLERGVTAQSRFVGVDEWWPAVLPVEVPPANFKVVGSVLPG